MVYIDDYEAPFGRMKMCHMVADTTEELLDMVAKIGVNKKWIQYPGTYNEHFDICLSKKAKAVAYGAKEISAREYAAFANSRKGTVIQQTRSHMQLKDAQAIAVTIGNTLLPYCDKLNIAGSIRRRKPEVKDIEIICLPKRIEQGQGSMFGNAGLPTIVCPEFSQLVLALGEVVKGKPDGKYMQIKLPAGIALDLFMPDSFDYYRQFVIRTGSADYSAKVIAGGWKKIGWCGSDQGLRLMKDCIETKDGTTGKSKWKCITANAQKPPVWDSEEAFFAWLQIPYLRPEQRNI